MPSTYTTRHEAVPERTRNRAPCLALALLLLINGCASVETTRNPAESPRPNPAVLVVASARFEPASKIDPVLRSKGDAAAQGAAGITGQAVVETLRDPFIVLFLPIIVPIGAAMEASVAAPEEIIASGRSAIEGAIAKLQLQQLMQERVVEELRAEAVGREISVNGDSGPGTPDERPIYRDVAAPMVLEVSVLEVGFSREQGYVREKTKAGKDGYALTLTTQARLLDTERHTVLDEMKRTHRSVALTATEWLQHKAESFERALNEAIQSNARGIVLEFFRLYYPPLQVEPEGTDSPIVPYYVLRPIYPEPLRGSIDLRTILSDKYVEGRGIGFSLVDDLRPTFRWETFPRPVDLAGRKGNGASFTDVSYELEVFQAEIKRVNTKKIYVAGPMLYRRSGLTEPQHHMEEPLQPCGRYAWTVRARFKLDGQPRVTEWTGLYSLNAMNPPPWHYRRSIPPYDSFSYDSSEWYPLLRTSPSEGATECAD